MAVLFRLGQLHGQLAVVDLDLVERLHRIEQQVVHDLLQRRRSACTLMGLPMLQLGGNAMQAQLRLQHSGRGARQRGQIDLLDAQGACPAG